MTWVLFTCILRFMPDAAVPWKHAALGAFVTVVLFTLGRIALYYYLSASNFAAQLGSASASLIVILLWVYYSSICLLFGAELTANLNTGRTIPEIGAVIVVEHEIAGPPNLKQRE
jgi:membrane protein